MEKRRPGRGQSQRVREVTRARLLAAAEEMFLSHGFAAATVDAIAHEAGYTTGAVYSNFGGKADLFLAVLDETAQEQLTAVRAALDSARSDEERLDVVNTSLGDPARWRAHVAATIATPGTMQSCKSGCELRNNWRTRQARNWSRPCAAHWGSTRRRRPTRSAGNSWHWSTAFPFALSTTTSWTSGRQSPAP